MKLALYRKRLAFLCVMFMLSGCSRASMAQTNAPAAAHKFDEFGDVYPTDMAARLDNFAIALQNDPGARGFLIVYRSHRDLPGLSGRHVNWMSGYLINLRGVSVDRIASVDGGEASCLSHELWIVPVGATPAPRPDAYAKGLDDMAVTRKFDEYYWDAPHALPDSFSSEYGDSLEGYAEALRKEPRSLAYIIAYAEYRVVRTEDVDERGRKETSREVWIDPPGTAARELKRRRDVLVKDRGISRSRVKVLNGGYRRWRQIELWIVPPGEHAPIPTPNAFPRPKHTPRRR
jgi:hypothetical protein